MPRGIGYRQREREGISQTFRKQQRRDLPAGAEAEDEAARRRAEFDAQAAAEESSRAQFDAISERLGRTLRDFRGTQVGSGRLDTGYRFEDEDELYEGALEDLGRSMSARALEVNRQNLTNIGGMERAGGARVNRALEILGSERDASLTEEEILRKEKERKRAGLFGFLGRVGGTLLGPAGSIVGEKIGERVESIFS